jgi:hypothetical protein
MPSANRSVQFNVPLKSSPRKPPDFPSLPARLSLLVIGLRIIVPASLRFTRLDCSVNPLEPKPSCLGTRFRSNKKFDWRALFLNNFLVRFHSLSGDAQWNLSGKDADKSGKNKNAKSVPGKPQSQTSSLRYVMEPPMAFSLFSRQFKSKQFTQQRLVSSATPPPQSMHREIPRCDQC